MAFASSEGMQRAPPTLRNLTLLDIRSQKQRVAGTSRRFVELRVVVGLVLRREQPAEHGGN